ncbi:hypothetical protein NDU88_007266 [Pleurodeles waltl]|uniref:Uncharacterized protein n=1 Tax=Pleurodeles waltl TaxID=8319 RepID=A0AAV7QPB9_PLEWA|nr:hypothetical protein NDU88_007266 [Pleurodeles waltl]
MPSRKLRDRVPVRVRMPAPGAVSRREGGGSWERAALEIQRVHAVTSRVALRGSSESAERKIVMEPAGWRTAHLEKRRKDWKQGGCKKGDSKILQTGNHSKPSKVFERRMQYL